VQRAVPEGDPLQFQLATRQSAGRPERRKAKKERAAKLTRHFLRTLASKSLRLGGLDAGISWHAD
jgi:hypothetical protein